MEFEWDIEKAKSNIEKHDVGFDEASTVFDDLFNIDFYDPEHSLEEHRYLIVGESNLERLLIVSLTAKERRSYEHGKFE